MCKQAGEILQFCFNYQGAGLKKNNPQRLTYVDVNSSSSDLTSTNPQLLKKGVGERS